MSQPAAVVALLGTVACVEMLRRVARLETFRTIAHVAATRQRREIRRRRAHPQLGLAVVAGAVFGVALVVGSVPVPGLESAWSQPGGYRYGTLLRDDPARVRSRVREVAAAGVVVTAALGALGATASDDWEDGPVELLTAIPAPVAIAAVLVDELLEASWFVGPIAVAGPAAFAAGTGQVATLAGALVGGLAVVATGLLAGTALGLGVRVAVRRSTRLYRLRHAIGIVTLFATFLTLSASRTAGAALAATPLGAFGDLVLATAPGAAVDPWRPLGALAAAAFVCGASLGICVAAARRLWFADALEAEPLDADGRERESIAGDSPAASAEGGSLPLDDVLARTAGRPTAAVVRATWRRMGRSPRALLYVVLPLAFVGPASAQVIARLPALVPVLVACYVAAAVGMGPTLNPLGNERVGLPLLLSTPDGRRAVLRGHALAALLPGVPLAVAATVTAGFVVGAGPAALCGLAVVAAALAIGGVGVSLGLGAFLPNVSASVAGTGTLTAPSLPATAAALLSILALGTPAFAGFGAPSIAGGPVALAAGVSGTVAVAAVAGGIGYRYAAGALERYEADGAER